MAISAVGLERRGSPRAPLDVLANRFLDGHPYVCRTADISENGIRVLRLSEPKLIPRFMGLQLQLPGSNEILSAAGEVVFCDDAARTVGLRFTTLPAATANAIAAFVTKNTADGKKPTTHTR
ncbi:MAG TPA: PilZ domain-containing protein [Polyangia bacterium]